ncbi:hypothetical protein [Flavobacterium algicola]|nr:hypothetical protein [Flavobacterium algicola]
MEAGFGFWTVFSLLTILGFVILWKPILWFVGTFSALSAGMD